MTLMEELTLDFKCPNCGGLTRLELAKEDDGFRITLVSGDDTSVEKKPK